MGHDISVCPKSPSFHEVSCGTVASHGRLLSPHENREIKLDQSSKATALERGGTLLVHEGKCPTMHLNNHVSITSNLAYIEMSWPLCVDDAR